MTSSHIKTIATPSWKHKLARITLTMLFVCNSVMLFAQQQGDGGAAPTTSNVRSSRSFTLDAIIVTAFIGLALFAICKAARRS